MDDKEPQFHLLVNAIIARNAARATPSFPYTRYSLAKALKGKVAQRSVYDFLDGKPVRTNTLFAILAACKIELKVLFEQWTYEASYYPARPRKEQLLDVIKKLRANQSANSLDDVISRVVRQTPAEPPPVASKPFMRMVSDLDEFPDDK